MNEDGLCVYVLWVCVHVWESERKRICVQWNWYMNFRRTFWNKQMWTLILCKSDWPRIINFYVELCERERVTEEEKKRVGWEVINRFYFCLTFSAYHNTTTSVLSKTETKEKQFLKSSADLGVVFLSWEKIWRSFSWHICVFVCAYINIHACFLCVRAYVRVHAHVLVYMCGCDHVWT